MDGWILGTDRDDELRLDRRPSGFVVPRGAAVDDGALEAPDVEHPAALDGPLVAALVLLLDGQAELDAAARADVRGYVEANEQPLLVAGLDALVGDFARVSRRVGGVRVQLEDRHWWGALVLGGFVHSSRGGGIVSRGETEVVREHNLLQRSGRYVARALFGDRRAQAAGERQGEGQESAEELHACGDERERRGEIRIAGPREVFIRRQLPWG